MNECPTFLEKITITSSSDLLKRFCDYGVVYIPNAKQLFNIAEGLSWRDLSSFFQRLEKDRESWTHETVLQDHTKNGDLSDVNLVALKFLSPNNHSSVQSGYCSFIVQHDIEVMNDLLNRLPISDLPFKESDPESNIKYGPGLWIFFGRNHSNVADGSILHGRGEHTDSVSHDGTWHYQMSGLKEWFIRPTLEMLNILDLNAYGDETVKQWKDEEDKAIAKELRSRLHIKCQAQDIILINTRLWWHMTQLPSGVDPSVSYARDIYLQSANDESNDEEEMTNVDGLYAAEDIEAGTIIFRERDMPDCEVRKQSANHIPKYIVLMYHL